MNEHAIDAIRDALAARIHGKAEAIDAIITCLVAGGHILIEDVPGVGKTTLAYALSKTIHCDFNRIQFTSDLIPSDILGVSVYQKSEERFRFLRGPIFANIVLADEINRAAPKSQSALLEVMERGLVSCDGESHAVEKPFMVVATQNPVDFESTFPLPNAQLDRFLMKISMGYPDKESEGRLLRSGALHYDEMDIKPVVERREILELHRRVSEVYIEDSLYDQIHHLVSLSRQHSQVELGISPRGALAFKTALQAAALVAGRDFVTPDDIRRYAKPCLAHRLLLQHHHGLGSQSSASARIIDELLNKTPAPHLTE